MKKFVLLYVVIIVVVLVLAVFQAGRLKSFFGLAGSAQAEIGQSKINLQVVKSEKDRMKGLSGKTSLGQNDGMLFVFDAKGKYPFWMKGMKFPIDIVYINDDTVVYLVENAAPEGQAPSLTVYTPDASANFVLEVNAGMAKKLGIKKGTKIILKGVK